MSYNARRIKIMKRRQKEMVEELREQRRFERRERKMAKIMNKMNKDSQASDSVSQSDSESTGKISTSELNKAIARATSNP